MIWDSAPHVEKDLAVMSAVTLPDHPTVSRERIEASRRTNPEP